MRRKKGQERRKTMMAAEMEKDTIYYLDFIPKGGCQGKRNTSLDDRWCVELPSNPEGRQDLIDEAIRIFEAKNNVTSWQEVAIRYEVNGFYYP